MDRLKTQTDIASYIGNFTCICTDDGSKLSECVYPEKEAIHAEIISVSAQAQKTPEEVASYLINARTLLVIRNGILVPIEKQLIRQGLTDQLVIAKRALEKRLLHNNNNFEAILQTQVIEIFVDWNFELDKSVIVFILNPTA